MRPDPDARPPLLDLNDVLLTVWTDIVASFFKVRMCKEKAEQREVWQSSRAH